MNIGKSTRIAMAKRGIRGNELAKQLGMSTSAVSILLSRPYSDGKRVAQLAAFFDMKVSEFIALGED